MALAKIDNESDDGTDEGTKLEEGPEDAERFAFILLEGITHHDTSLGGPKESGSETEKRTGQNQEPVCALGLVTCKRGRE